MTKASTVIKKIKKRILEDMKTFETSDDDMKIIKENFEFKQPSYTRLGSGTKHILEDIVTPLICNAYSEELREAVFTDLSKDSNKEK